MGSFFYEISFKRGICTIPTNKQNSPDEQEGKLWEIIFSAAAQESPWTDNSVVKWYRTLIISRASRWFSWITRIEIALFGSNLLDSIAQGFCLDSYFKMVYSQRKLSQVIFSYNPSNIFTRERLVQTRHVTEYAPAETAEYPRICPRRYSPTLNFAIYVRAFSFCP